MKKKGTDIKRSKECRLRILEFEIAKLKILICQLFLDPKIPTCSFLEFSHYKNMWMSTNQNVLFQHRSNNLNFVSCATHTSQQHTQHDGSIKSFWIKMGPMMAMKIWAWRSHKLYVELYCNRHWIHTVTYIIIIIKRVALIFQWQPRAKFNAILVHVRPTDFAWCFWDSASCSALYPGQS